MLDICSCPLESLDSEYAKVLIIGPVSSTETVVIMRGEMCLLHVLKRETEHGSGHACYGRAVYLRANLK